MRFIDTGRESRSVGSRGRRLGILGLVVLGSAPASALIVSPAVSSRVVAQTGVVTTGGGGTAPKLTQPANVRMLSRSLRTNGTTNVSVGWYDVSTDDVQTVLERQLAPDGAWSVRQTIGPVDYQASATDTGLAPDTRYCYRVTNKSSTGATRTSLPTCVVTQKAGDVPVSRVQLRVVVANVSGGGTDGWVSVALTEPPGNLPTGNFTGINTARDDLATGSDVAYELNVDGVESFRDITRISMGTTSTDAFCVQQIQLLVNGNENNDLTPDSGTVVFDRFYGSAANTCRWVGSTYGSLVITHGELRATPAFAGFAGGQALVSIGKSELESRLEPIIGTLFWQRTDIAWDSDQSHAVTASRKSADTVHVHLDLEAPTGGPNPEVDIDFDVTLSFQFTEADGWNLIFDAHDLTTNVDFSWWVEVLSGLLDPICAPTVAIAQGRDPFLDCISELESHIEDEIEAHFDAPSNELPVVLPEGCIEPTVGVASDVSVRFGCDDFGIGGTGGRVLGTPRIRPRTTLLR